MPKTASRRTPYHSSSRWRHEDWYSLQGLADAVGDVDDQQAMEGQALGRVDAERDHSRGRDRSTSTLASASPAILTAGKKVGHTFTAIVRDGQRTRSHSKASLMMRSLGSSQR